MLSNPIESNRIQSNLSMYLCVGWFLSTWKHPTPALPPFTTNLIPQTSEHVKIWSQRNWSFHDFHDFHDMSNVFHVVVNQFPSVFLAIFAAALGVRPRRVQWPLTRGSNQEPGGGCWIPRIFSRGWGDFLWDDFVEQPDYHNYLVGGWATPLKNMSSSIYGWWHDPNISGKIKNWCSNQTTNQLCIAPCSSGHYQGGAPPVISWFIIPISIDITDITP